MLGDPFLEHLDILLDSLADIVLQYQGEISYLSELLCITAIFAENNFARNKGVKLFNKVVDRLIQNDNEISIELFSCVPSLLLRAAVSIDGILQTKLLDYCNTLLTSEDKFNVILRK